MKDTQLEPFVQKAINQEPEAFSQLCESIAQDVLYICIKIMGSRPDGEDAAQEVFIRVQKNIAGLKSAGAFKTWLNRIIFSVCADQRRGKVNKIPVVPIEDEADTLREEYLEFLPQEYVEDESKRQELLSAIENLPERYKQAVLLYYYEELSQVQIAEVMGTTRESVDHTLRRARASIKKQLEKKDRSLAGFMPFMTAAPLLGSVLQSDSAQTVTQEMIQKLLSGLGFLAAGAAGTAGAASSSAGGSAASSGAATAGGASTAAAGGAAAAGGITSVLAIAAAALVLVGGGAALYASYNKDPLPVASESSIVQPVQASSNGSVSVSVSATSSAPSSAPSSSRSYSYSAPQVSSSEAAEAVTPPPPSSSSAQPAPQPTIVRTLNGTLGMVNDNLLPLSDETARLSGSSIQLWQGDYMLDEAPVGSDGKFQFQGLALVPGNYLLVFVPHTNNPNLVLVEDKNTNCYVFTVREGYGTTHTMEHLSVIDYYGPRITISFTGASQGAVSGVAYDPTSVSCTIRFPEEVQFVSASYIIYTQDGTQTNLLYGGTIADLSDLATVFSNISGDNHQEVLFLEIVAIGDNDVYGQNTLRFVLT